MDLTKKLYTKIKKYDFLFITFFIGLIIIGIIYKLQSVAPLGKNSLLTVDFYHQYGPMLAEFYDRITNGENLIYSFNTGLGLPIFRNFFNYLSSPINILLLLFKRKNIVMSYSLIIGLKSILSSITCTYYLKWKLDLNKYLSIPLGILYAFSAYFTAYYWNIMWIDGMYMLPLITLGIENIINKNNGLLYTISLSLMLYINYFIGYMLCIFSCIYFVLYLIIKTNKFNIKDIIKKIVKFSICSLISGALMAWTLIPMFEALISTNATTGSMPTTQYYAFTILEFIQNSITGVKSTVFASDISNAPNVSCGILSVSLLFMFLLNNNISIKKKIIYTFLLIFLLCSFYIAPLDYIWHAFHVPNDLPYRYSFIYSFILITISAYSLKNIENISYIKTLIAYLLSLTLITFVYLSKYNNIESNMININYLLITTYFLIYNLYHFYPNYKKLSIIIFITVISIECIITVNHNWNVDQNLKDFYSTYKNINENITEIKNEEKELFYRTENNDFLTLNDGAWYDYYGQTTFTSMAYNSIAELNNDLGLPGNDINSYYYKQNTPIYDIMFNVKYTIGNNVDLNRYENIKNNIFKFKYTTGLMFGVNNSIKNWNYNYMNPMEYQNDFIYKSTNIENILYRLKLIKKDIIFENNKETIIKYNYKNEFDNIYLYTNNYLVNYIIINDKVFYKTDSNINDIGINTHTNLISYNTYDEPYIINEFSNNEEIEIYVSFKSYLNEEIDVYTINNQKFNEAYKKLIENKIKITDFSENEILGNINLDKDKTIYTSIPYDKGWKIFVNNKEINTFKINNSLLGFDLKKGENNIILKYLPNNLDIGLGISITSLIFSSTYLIVKKKKINLS